MPTRDEWLALAERCETAEGPDRELDRAFGAALHPDANLWTPSFWSGGPNEFLRWPDRENGAARYEMLPQYTTSLDAAVAVVEEYFGRRWQLKWLGDEHGHDIVDAWVEDAYGNSYVSPALALMAAYCRARAEEETT